ncbi:type II toxin-antitoxin system RelE/ParE family toxin [Campylobacter ureolyticus]|uniref:Addiction module toxin, RelE/StbE family n=1 Tax=Campylobacter ureolyticus TaxID=827 RepID=S5UK03_9BACT|nr:type II toxin-antitoxin system YafQ family toxin [Campylobacter ureolyticus]AGS56935.1 addiction module toxin, RelE/StbE family [Campylobacter ureolyticus DSM 20703]MCR8684948.1 type II toxin-antitoxin system YafQ family toxin [Campylobacter ureolyticus]QKF83698.1 toxin-antitoxin system, toxin component, YafQ family [Campylobacter ureolyticus]QQY36146.1 type II toxin-antitoxin system YafQ family toxin [Campylobacter ureolyticus]SUX24980.1 addiction module antitoxin [Campylobacter ureolyticu
MKYKIIYSKNFKTSFKKLTAQQKDLIINLLEKLAKDETLDKKYKDHQLKGKLKNFRDCHIMPDLVLIYKKDYDILILEAIDIGKHSKLF